MKPFVSYAQNFEDVLLWRALRSVESGFYIDIGANSPTIDSVSMAFYERGWRGINVEPSLAYFNELCEQRKNDINTHVALSSQAGLLKFYEIPETGLSTLKAEVAAINAERGFQVEEMMVPVITLDELLRDLPVTDVHWMKIDVEGAEQDVLVGWKNSPVRPWIVMVESVRPATHEDSFDDWEHLLLEKGYRFVHFDGLNRYYVSSEHVDLADCFVVGPNVFDRFSLSGTATSSFCAVLNFRSQEDRQEAEERGRQMEEGWSREREELTRIKAGVEEQLELSLQQGKDKQVSFELAEHQWERKQHAMQNHIGQIESRVKDLDVELTQIRAALDIAQAQFESLSLQSQADKSALQDERNSLQRNLISLLTEARQMTEDRNQALQATRQQEHHVARMQAEREVVGQERSALLGELQQMSEAMAGMRTDLQKSRNFAIELLTSKSWKLTAPVRFVSAFLRGRRGEASGYFNETVKVLARRPLMRKLARLLLSGDGRARRFLMAKISEPTGLHGTTQVHEVITESIHAPCMKRRLIDRMNRKVRGIRLLGNV